jgi:hypothetical protein
VCNALKAWWIRKGIELTSNQATINHITKIHDKWRYLVKVKDNEMLLKEQKEAFKEMCEQTFIPVSEKPQKKLENSTSKRNVENVKYLQVRKSTRNALLGTLDKKKITNGLMFHKQKHN